MWIAPTGRTLAECPLPEAAAAMRHWGLRMLLMLLV